MNSRIAPFEALSMRAGRLAGGEDADAVDVRALVRTFWQNRWRIFGAMSVVGLAVFVLVSLMTPTYSAYAKVMLDPRKARIITTNEVVADLEATEAIVNGELAVLRSNLLLERVIAMMDPALLDRFDPALQPPTMIAQAKTVIKSLLPDMSAPVAVSSVSPEDQRVERLVSALRKRLKVYNESVSYVMVIRADTRQPALSMALADSVSEGYIRLQLENRQNAVGQATVWLEERLVALRTQVEAAESAVAQFQAASLINDGGTLDNASQQLSNLNSQLIEARAARVEAEARLAQLNTVIETAGTEAGARIVDTPAIQALRAQALDLRQKDAVWARTYDEDQDRRVEIRNELAEIALAMQFEVGNVVAVRESELEIARIREDSLRDSISVLEGRVMQISQSRLGLRQLEREASAARGTYEALLTRITEARTQRQLQQADAKLVEHAVMPRSPSAPKTKLLAVLGAAMGGIGMIAWIFFNEMTASTFRTARELENETGLPVLSSLPLDKWRDARTALSDIRRDPYGGYAERIRQLRTALLMRKNGDHGQSVLMMSSAPGEGKTTAALALAQMAALAGKSTVIVDCDLRRPRVRSAIDLQMTHDFADFIEGTCSLPDVIYTSVENGFDVIAARSPRPAAADELSTVWLRPLLAELCRVYDFVVVDAPAMLAVSDGLILAEVVDTRVYLVASNTTPRVAVRDGLSRLSEMGFGVVGTILNKVDARSSPDPYAEGYRYDA